MPTLSRRDFLSLCASAAAVPAFGSEAKPSTDAAQIVLLSDNHLTGTIPGRHQNVEMERTVREILAMRPLPGNVLVFGDLAFERGVAEDYRANRQMLVKPLQDAGIRVTLGLGNHDRHATFAAEMPDFLAASKVPGKMVSVVETPNVDFIVLDSCLDGPVPGAIGVAQRQWLEETVKAARKPFFVGSHHPLSEVKIGPLLAASPFCAGYIHGHDHFWQTREFGGSLPVLCLPSTGYWGDIGYAVMQTDRRGAAARSRVVKFIDNSEREPPAFDGQKFGSPDWRIAIASRYVAEYKDGNVWRVAFGR